MDFINPGDAAGQAISNFLLQQRAQKQQDIQNAAEQQRIALEGQRQDRLSTLEQLEIQEKRASMARQAHQDDLDAAKQAADGLVPGDIPDAETTQTLKKGGLGGTIHPGQSQTTTIPASPVTPTPGAVIDPATNQVSSQPALPLPGAQPAQSTTLAGPDLYTGTSKQRDAQTQHAAQLKIADLIEQGATPATITATAIRLGVDPKMAEGALAAGKQTFTPEESFIAKDSTGKVLPGVISVAGGVPHLNGQPLPPGATVERAPAPRDPILDQLAQAEIYAKQHPQANGGVTNVYTLGTDGKPVLTGTVPTHSHFINTPAAVVARTDMAGKVASHFPDIQNEIEQADAKGLLGPLAGRTMSQFLAGAVGSTGNPENDALLDALKLDLTLISSGVASLHGRQGANQGIAKDIKTLLDTNKMSRAGLEGALGRLKVWTDTYAGTGATPGDSNAKPDLIWDPATKTFKKP